MHTFKKTESVNHQINCSSQLNGEAFETAQNRPWMIWDSSILLPDESRFITKLAYQFIGEGNLKSSNTLHG